MQTNVNIFINWTAYDPFGVFNTEPPLTGDNVFSHPYMNLRGPIRFRTECTNYENTNNDGKLWPIQGDTQFLSPSGFTLSDHRPNGTHVCHSHGMIIRLINESRWFLYTNDPYHHEMELYGNNFKRILPDPNGAFRIGHNCQGTYYKAGIRFMPAGHYPQPQFSLNPHGYYWLTEQCAGEIITLNEPPLAPKISPDHVILKGARPTETQIIDIDVPVRNEEYGETFTLGDTAVSPTSSASSITMSTTHPLTVKKVDGKHRVVGKIEVNGLKVPVGKNTVSGTISDSTGASSEWFFDIRVRYPGIPGTPQNFTVSQVNNTSNDQAKLYMSWDSISKSGKVFPTDWRSVIRLTSDSSGNNTYGSSGNMIPNNSKTNPLQISNGFLPLGSYDISFQFGQTIGSDTAWGPSVTTTYTVESPPGLPTTMTITHQPIDDKYTNIYLSWGEEFSQGGTPTKWESQIYRNVFGHIYHFGTSGTSIPDSRSDLKINTTRYGSQTVGQNNKPLRLDRTFTVKFRFGNNGGWGEWYETSYTTSTTTTSSISTSNGKSSSISNSTAKSTSPTPTPTPPPPVGPTASFRIVPENHNGRGSFQLELHFSGEPKGLGYATVRDSLLNVTGARLRRAKRKTRGSNQAWVLTVQPSGSEDVTLNLPARACGSRNAICIGGNPLRSAVSVTVPSQ